MTAEEKGLRMMFAKPMMEDVLDKVLDRINDVAKAVGLEPPEFMLAFFMDCLATALKVGEETGYHVDLDGFVHALKKKLESKA